MSCIHISSCPPCWKYGGKYHSSSASLAPLAAPALCFQRHWTLTPLTATKSSYLGSKFLEVPPRLLTSAARFQQSAPVLLFGGKGKSEGGDKLSSPWKPLEEAMGKLKEEQSIEDVLRKQMNNKEYYDDGGSGGDRPGGGGGGGGGGDGDADGSGESEEESISGMLEELVQVMLATFGFVFLYMFIIEGEEITRFGKDIIKFIFTGQKSIRLTRLIDSWVKFFEESKLAKDPDPFWLEREILNTTTWYDSPTKYRRILRSYMSSSSD